MKRRPLLPDSLRARSRNFSVAMGASAYNCNLIVFPRFEIIQQRLLVHDCVWFFLCVQACLELIDGKGGLFSCLDDIQRFEGKEANLKFLSSFKQKHGPPAGGGGGGGANLRCACHRCCAFVRVLDVLLFTFYTPR